MRWISVCVLALLLVAPQKSFAQATGTITGTVTGSRGAPLAGAAVAVTGTTRGSTTDAQGRFSITAVPAGARTVRATFAGYGEGTRPVTVAAGQTATVTIALSAQAIQLEEVVAIGYGTARRKDLTGSVASVGSDQSEVKAAPTVTAATALQGKAPGVQVISNSGAPGAGVSVRVRGSNSITANSEPLYVIDGLPVTQGSGSNNATDNPLAAIDPSDIESMQILKDAASTSIYGARGANGVILITTRRGARGQSKVEFETSYGVQQISKNIDVLNGPDFMQFVNEANVNAGRAARYSAAEIAAAPTYDYQGAILRNAPQMNHSVTLSGGDEKTRFLIGGNYSSQQGIVMNTNFSRYGLRLNLDRDISTRFRVGNSLSLTYVLQHQPVGGAAVTTAMQYFPFVPFRDANGDWIRDLGFLGVQGIGSNPVANATDVINDQNQWRGIGNLFGEYDLTDALKLRSSVGGNFGFSRNGTFNPRTVNAGFATNGSATLGTAQTVDLTNENLLTYSRPDFGPGNLDLLGGVSVQRFRTDSQTESGSSLPSDAISYNNLGITTLNRTVASGITESTLLSYLGRANYNLLDKYLFTLTGRRDGSSRFGANNKWAFFPSAAFAWRVIDEDFMKGQPLFSDLKFRVSYGRTGNQAINEYQSLPQLTTGFVGTGTSAVEQTTIAPNSTSGNPNLKWETQDQANLGLDLGWIDNRVTLTVDAYQSKTSDLLLSVNLPTSTGFTSQLQNVGSVRNRGVEAAINTLNHQGDFFTWRSTLNLSHNRNEVLSLYNGLQQILPAVPQIQGIDGETNVIRVGEPLGAIYGIKTEGLYQAGDACPLTQTPAFCAPGELKTVDLNNDGQINLNDRQILGYADPKVYGGFNNSMTFGPVSLDAFFNFSYGNKLANMVLGYSGLGRAIVNERADIILNRWSPTNTGSSIPRANNARPGFLYDTMVEDASFLRLQTLTLGYRLPDNFIPALSSTRLFLTGQNVFVATKYSGFDPEVNARGGSSTLRGVDVETYPRARVWNIGANVAF
jgi:TonB-linked SusC/RagA family outer membrane protein